MCKSTRLEKYLASEQIPFQAVPIEQVTAGDFLKVASWVWLTRNVYLRVAKRLGCCLLISGIVVFLYALTTNDVATSMNTLFMLLFLLLMLLVLGSVVTIVITGLTHLRAKSLFLVESLPESLPDWIIRLPYWVSAEDSQWWVLSCNSRVYAVSSSTVQALEQSYEAFNTYMTSL